MTRVRYILAAIFTLAVVGFVTVALWPPSPGVTHANFDRIQDGMTVAEVEAIMGKPDQRLGTERQWWTLPSGNSATVVYSEELVTEKIWPDADETIVRKIWRWLSPPSRTTGKIE
jgi:hypothetical protein